MYSGELPVPRPGACINDAVRKQGIERSLDLPDKTLQFVRDRPLMDEAVQPLNGGPQLLKRGPMFTRIVVDRVIALNGGSYDVMFIGTENGFVQKAVNYDGEMYIIEEVQLLQHPEPIKTLRLSRSTGQLYAGSETGAVQMALSECGRYSSCLDCVLARDPYCAWDPTAAVCTAVASSHANRTLIQSLKDGNASLCPSSVRMEPEICTLIPGNNIQLQCQPDSNLAQVLWLFESLPLHPSSKHFFYREGLMILDASAADSGLYECQAVEQVKGRQYPRTIAAYQLQPSKPGPDLPPTETELPPTALPVTDSITDTPESYTTPQLLVVDPPSPQSKSTLGKLIAMQVSVAVLSVLLIALLTWNVCQGHLPFLGRYGAMVRRGSVVRQTQNPPQNFTSHQVPFQAKVPAESKLLMTPSNCNSSNNHSGEELTSNSNHNLSPRVIPSMDVFKYINDESEI
ncbi:hypothetical protein JZ751_025169 [Albula glossodonta]|uniref:Semaphorin-1A n=1 Tax=Albula glossodonta TaxID=121402 RepID=A0A8T2PMV5_9TELE|nr:hypothetical protein JZ751_025169 [Albula glossodonta]